MHGPGMYDVPLTLQKCGGRKGSAYSRWPVTNALYVHIGYKDNTYYTITGG